MRHSSRQSSRRAPRPLASLSASPIAAHVRRARSSTAFLPCSISPGSRYNVNQLLTLLELTAVQRRFGFESSDLPLVSRWLRETGVRWGIDQDSRAALGLPAIREHTWRAGLDRLLLGYALPGDPRTFFADLLPYDAMEGADAQILGRLHTFTEATFGLVTTLRGPRSVDQWVSTSTGCGAIFSAG